MMGNKQPVMTPGRGARGRPVKAGRRPPPAPPHQDTWIPAAVTVYHLMSFSFPVSSRTVFVFLLSLLLCLSVPDLGQGLVGTIRRSRPPTTP